MRVPGCVMAFPQKKFISFLWICNENPNILLWNWRTTNTATTNSLSSFLKRHSTLLIRTLYVTSLNKATVSINITLLHVWYFRNGGSLAIWLQWCLQCRWNGYHDCAATLQNIAKNCVKQVVSLTLANGRLVTVAFAVHAIGSMIFTIFVFLEELTKNNLLLMVYLDEELC